MWEEQEIARISLPRDRRREAVLLPGLTKGERRIYLCENCKSKLFKIVGYSNIPFPVIECRKCKTTHALVRAERKESRQEESPERRKLGEGL